MAEVVAAALVAAAVLLVAPSAADDRARALARPAAPPRLTVRGLMAAVRGSVDRASFGPWARRRRAHRQARLIQALSALSAELDAGQPPRAALLRAAGDPPAWPAAAGAARFGGDLAEALATDAAGSAVLAQLSACWQVAADSGAGLAASVARLARSARAAEDVRVALEGQLAAPRATARLLGLLPALGIGFGIMLGADPLAWLTTTSAGRLCLVAGVTLTVVGLWWTGRIAAAVERLL